MMRVAGGRGAVIGFLVSQFMQAPPQGGGKGRGARAEREEGGVERGEAALGPALHPFPFFLKEFQFHSGICPVLKAVHPSEEAAPTPDSWMRPLPPLASRDKGVVCTAVNSGVRQLGLKSLPIYMLCNLEQVTSPLWATVSLAVKCVDNNDRHFIGL